MTPKGVAAGTESQTPPRAAQPRADDNLVRARAMHARCSRALMQASEEHKLLQAMCRIAVEAGGYPMAWIGFVDQDNSRTVVPVAHAGCSKEFLDKITAGWGASRRGHSPTGNAIRTRKTCVSRNVVDDPGLAPWRDAAREFGFTAVVALPLVERGVCLGSFFIHAAAPGAFDAEEITVLEDLAADIAYGVSALRARSAQAQAEQRFRATFEQAAVGIAHTSLDGRYLLVNRKFCEIVGYRHEDLMAQSPAGAHADPLGISDDVTKQLIDAKLDKFVQEKRYVRKDGSIVWISRTISLARDDDGKPLYLIRVIEDISERKRSEERLQRLSRSQEMTSECRRALARSNAEAELLDALCRIVVETGGYRQAWIGFAVDDECKSIAVASHAGFEGGTPRVQGASWGGFSSPDYQGVMGGVIASGERCLVCDFARDVVHPARLARALERGYRSALTLPLKDGKRCYGALAIYSREADAFDTQEVNLLEQLVSDIAGGINMLRVKAAREQAETASRQNEQRFRSTFNQAAVGICHASLDDRYLLVNEKFCEMVGYGPDELIGRSADIVTHRDDLSTDSEQRRHMLEGRLDTSPQEKRYRCKDGTLIWVNRTETLVRDENGQPQYFIRMIEDISARKRGEERLRKQNALRVLLESLAVAANQASTPEQALRVCLARICSYGGWPIGHVVMFGDSELSEDKRTSIWHLSESGRWEAFRRISEPLVLRDDGTGFVNHVIASRRPLWVEDIADLEPFRRGGVARELGLKSAFSFPVVAGQQVVAFLEFFSNTVMEPDEALLEVTTNIGAQLARVVERRQAEITLRDTGDQFRAIVSQASVGITEVALDGRYLLVNDKYCEITGYSREEMLQMSVHDLISPLDVEHAALLRAQLLSGEIDTLREERRILNKNGDLVWVNVSSSLMRDENGGVRHFLSMIEDISQRKHTEAALHESEEQFLQLANHIPQMFWITSVGQRDVVYLSPAFEQITGYSIEAAKKSSRVLVAMVHPDDRRRVQKARKNAGAGGYDETFRLVRPDGSVRWVRDQAFPIRDVNGQAYRIAGIGEDITERKHAEERVLQLSHYDALTNLPNRVLCYDRLQQALAQATRNQWSMAVMFADLDRFKNINDTLGHSVGDALLQQASERLAGCVRTGDTVGRSGGDEYMLVLSNLRGAQDAGVVAQKITAAFAEPFTLDGREVYVTVSLGIALYPGDSKDQDELVRDADTAMYRAKELGRNNFQFYQASMNAKALDKLNLENGLRRALEQNEFRLFLQPKASLVSGEITGFEALLRWQHPQRGLVSPLEFIPLLEETGLIVQAGEWVIRAASAQLKAWRDAGIQPRPIAVNLAARQFQSPELGSVITGILAEYGVEAGLLELEITESSLMHNTEDAVRTMEYLVSLGLRISIDDFGTGYSSLAYLKRFPLDALKIDRTFVKDIGQDSDDTAITLALISLAHNLGLKVIAEGVETGVQQAFLTANGCDEIQGYHFAKPLAAAECTEFLRQDRRLPRPAMKREDEKAAILLVDDDEDTLLLMKRMLSSDEYDVWTASSAQLGLQLLAEHNIKVVVSDQQMPGMNGVEFLRRVKLLHPHTVRIMLSGQTEFETVSAAINQGEIYRFLGKNWTKEKLRKEIREACAAAGAGKAGSAHGKAA